MPLRWEGTLTLAPMAAIFAGTGGDTPEHRHLAHKIVVGATAAGPAMQLRRGDEAIAIPAGEHHQVLAARRQVVLVYLDARRFRWSHAARLAERWRRLSPGAGPGCVPGCALDALLEDIASLSAWTADARALAAIEAMADGDSLVDVGCRLGLSESRVTHLVTEQLGAPPRAWRTWLRLRSAVDLLGEGETVTSAAHAAGFADSAHFSRTCSLSLGIAPSALRKLHIDRVRSPIARLSDGSGAGSVLRRA
jgi:AraC-like DNA-binding protein